MGFASKPSTWSPRERAAVQRQAASGRKTESTKALKKEQVAQKSKVAVAKPAGGLKERGYITEVIKRPVSGKGPIIREVTARPSPRAKLKGKVLITETVTRKLTPVERYKEFEKGASRYLKEKAPVLFGREGAFGAGPTGREIITIREMKTPVRTYLAEKAPRLARGLEKAEAFIGGAEVGAREQITEKPVSTAITIGVGYGVGLVGSGALAIGGKVATSMKVVGYGLGGLYAGTKGYEIYKEPSYFKKGKVAGGTAIELTALGIGAKGAGVTVRGVKKALTPTRAKYVPETGKAYVEAYKLRKDITVGRARELKATYEFEYPKDIFSRGIQKIATRVGRAPPKYAYLEAPTAEFVSVKIGKDVSLAARYQYETVTKYPKGKTVVDFYESRAFAPKIKGLKHDVLGIAEKRPIKFEGFEIAGEKYVYIREKGLITGEGIFYETAKIGTQVTIKGKPYKPIKFLPKQLSKLIRGKAVGPSVKYYPEKALTWKLTKEPFPLTEIKGEYAIQTARARELEITGKKTYLTKYLETDPYFKTKILETGRGKLPKPIEDVSQLKLGRLDLPIPKTPKARSIVKGDRLFSEVYASLGKPTTRAIPKVTEKFATEVIPKSLVKPVPITKTDLITIPSLRMRAPTKVKPARMVDVRLSDKEMLKVTPIQKIREVTRTRAKERERLGLFPIVDTRLIAREKVGLIEADLVGTVTSEILKEDVSQKVDVRTAQRLDTRIGLDLMPATLIGTGWGFPDLPSITLGKSKPPKPIRPKRGFGFFPSIKALEERTYGDPFKVGVSVRERPITKKFARRASRVIGGFM